MSKLMMLEVHLLDIGTIRRLVSVENEDQFIGHYRASCLQGIIDRNTVGNNVLQFTPSDNAQLEALRSIKVKLRDTGLTEAPSTEVEIEALYRRFNA